MFTHFATADEADDSFVDRQYQHMLEAEAICGAQGVHPMIHVSNSAAITRYPDYRRDMVRLGISLYGCPPSDLLAGAADLLSLIHISLPTGQGTLAQGWFPPIPVRPVPKLPKP